MTGHKVSPGPGHPAPRSSVTDRQLSGVAIDGVEIETFVEEDGSIAAHGDGLGMMRGSDRHTAIAGLVLQVLWDKAWIKAHAEARRREPRCNEWL